MENLDQLMGVSPIENVKKTAVKCLIYWSVFLIIMFLLGKMAFYFSLMFIALPGIPFSLIFLIAKYFDSRKGEIIYKNVKENIIEGKINPSYIGTTPQWYSPVVVDEKNSTLLIGDDLYPFNDVKSINEKNTQGGPVGRNKIEIVLFKGSSPVKEIIVNDRDVFFHRLSNSLGFS